MVLSHSGDIDFQFTVPDLNNEPQLLIQHDVSVGGKTLGVFLAPDGNNDEAFNHMTEQVKTWTDHIRVGHLNASDV